MTVGWEFHDEDLNQTFAASSDRRRQRRTTLIIGTLFYGIKNDPATLIGWGGYTILNTIRCWHTILRAVGGLF